MPFPATWKGVRHDDNDDDKYGDDFDDDDDDDDGSCPAGLLCYKCPDIMLRQHCLKKTNQERKKHINAQRLNFLKR